MRVVLAIATVTLTLALTCQPTSALQGSDNVSPIGSLHMIDAQVGWATTAHCGPCPAHVVPGLLILRTTNGGTRWKDVTPVDSSGKRSDVNSFYPLNSQVAWVEKRPENPSPDASSEVVRTVDGGETWKAITSPGWWRIVSFLNPREGWLIHPLVGYLGHTDVDIYRTLNGGTTWTKVSSNRDASSGLTNLSGITGIRFFDSRTGWITGFSIPSDWQYLYVTHDGGRTWQPRKLPLPPQLTPHWQANLSPPDVFGVQNGVMRADYLTLHPIDDPMPQTEYAGPVMIFYVTHDSGATWTYRPAVPVAGNDTSPRLRPSTFIDVDHGWIKDGDTLYVTNDGGRQWTKIHSSELFGDVTQLAFISRNTGWAVRSTDSYGGGARQAFPFLLKTADGGHTWTAVPYTIDRR